MKKDVMFSCQENDGEKLNRLLWWHKSGKSAFSLAEVTVVLVIMAGILLLVGRIVLGDRQKEYDAKISKLSTVVSSNITKDLVENTGAEYADYASTAKIGEKDGNEIFKEAVTNNLNQKPCTDCWNTETVGDDDSPKKFKNVNSDNWDFYELNDKTVMAVSKTKTTDNQYYDNDILIDANGKKGPNELGKDIQIYNYPYKTCNHIGNEPDDCKTIYYCNKNEADCRWDRTGCRKYHIETLGFDNNKESKSCSTVGCTDKPYISTHTSAQEEVPACKRTATYTYTCNSNYNKPNDTTGTVVYNVQEEANGCKWKPDCKSGLQGGTNRATKPSGSPLACACTNTSAHDANDLRWYHNNAANQDCSWICNTSNNEDVLSAQKYDSTKHSDKRYSETAPTTANSCEYKYPCSTSTASDVRTAQKYDSTKHSDNRFTALTPTTSNSCEYKYDCNASFTGKADTDTSDYNTNTVARSKSSKHAYNYTGNDSDSKSRLSRKEDFGKCDYTYSYSCTSAHMNEYTDFNSSVYNASCDLDSTTAKQPGKTCADLTGAKYTRQRSLIKGTDNKYTCKWTYDCNTNFTGKADSDTSDYNATAVTRTKGSKHAYNYTGNENAANKVDNGKCDYTYTYQCQGGNGFQANWLDGYDKTIVGSSCDLDYTGTGNKQECKDLINKKYTRQRELYNDGNKFSCKWNYGCNSYYTGKADSDTSEYNANTVARSKSSKHAYNYTKNETDSTSRLNRKEDLGKCDYTYSYVC